MENIIASYLFQNKICPLPHVGLLSLSNKTAAFVLGEKQFHPPLMYISFSPEEISAEEFINYISFQKNISREQAANEIESYCSKLKNLDSYSEMLIPGVGKFYTDTEGSLVFKQIDFPETFLPPVHAEKIIHPESTHTLLVGDKESNSALMTEFYSEGEKTKKRSWLGWAALLALVGIIIIAVYYTKEINTGSFGNAEKIHPASEARTYKSSQ